MPKLTIPVHNLTENSKPKPGFDSRPNTGFIRQSHILEVVPFSAATLWRMVRAGTFPAPTKLSTRVTAWRVSQIREWMAIQSAA